MIHAISSAVAFNELFARLRPSANVVKIGAIPFPLSFHPNFSMLISSDHFLFALDYILQNMNKNCTEKIFNNVKQNALIISKCFANSIYQF